MTLPQYVWNNNRINEWVYKLYIMSYKTKLYRD
jgi:hypothetical protein